MKFAILSLTFLAIASATASPAAVATPAARMQERQDSNIGDSIRNSVSSELASRMSSISSAGESRSSSLNEAASSRSSSLDSAASSRSSSIASVTLNHPTQAFASGNNCNGVNININGVSTCCDGPLINNKCYNLSSTINGGTQTPTNTGSPSDSQSDSGSNNDNSNSGHGDNGGLSVVAQPAALLLGLVGGAAFLLV